MIKTLQAIEQSHVVLFLVDAQRGLVEQDLKLLGFVVEEGKGVVLLINKWDGLTPEQREQLKMELDRRLPFVHFARRYTISALHGTGVGSVYHAIDEAYDALQRDMPTPALTRILMKAVDTHQPPLVSGRRVRLRYAHLGGRNPLQVIVHGKQVNELPGAYKKYLSTTFLEAF